ncbi:hypothetical protein T4A_8707 [Trichinella pseudospiralis]|uniref:Uncharacterized protein n=1 Tax=Trichinella pseudospiralis TaxID=6337 RepID=A0A0V1E9S7_TRIPS|nr:hypothetical protein T4A_8707 [Trichinella pseudospiralis]
MWLRIAITSGYRKETMINSNLSEAISILLNLFYIAKEQIYHYKKDKYNNATEGRKNKTSTIREMGNRPLHGIGGIFLQFFLSKCHLSVLLFVAL